MVNEEGMAYYNNLINGLLKKGGQLDSLPSFHQCYFQFL